MFKKASGKSHRTGIRMVKLFRRFPDDATAEAWLIEQRWPNGIACPHCSSMNVQTVAKHKTMPYRCCETQCVKRLSLKTGTVMGGGEARIPGVGHRHVPDVDQPHVGVEHEAPQQSEHRSAVGLVPRPPIQGGALGGGRGILGACRVG